MAIDVYLQFIPFNGDPPTNPIPASSLAEDKGTFFEIDDYSVDFEQTLNIGSQSSGAGAGKISFNPLTVTRRSDTLTPKLFQNMCSGTPYKGVKLWIFKAGASGHTLDLVLTFKLVAVKTLTFAPDDSGTPSETVQFEYGGLQIAVGQQNTKGQLTGTVATGGWNRVKNTADATDGLTIK